MIDYLFRYLCQERKEGSSVCVSNNSYSNKRSKSDVGLREKSTYNPLVVKNGDSHSVV